MNMNADFVPYVARGRSLGAFSIDMHITDPVAKEWYDPGPDLSNRERKWCFENIKPGFNILDCGAHQGWMTIFFALCTGPTGIVHAWEPSSRNAELISRNAKLNGCNNVFVHARGISDKSGSLPFFGNAGNVVLIDEATPGLGIDEVQVVRLDEDVEPNLRVDFVKIDVEGHDLPALQGAKGILEMRPYLLLELHLFLYKDKMMVVTEIINMLTPYGYKFYIDEESGIVDIGTNPDTSRIVDLNHGHLFCVPAR